MVRVYRKRGSPEAASHVPRFVEMKPHDFGPEWRDDPEDPLVRQQMAATVASRRHDFANKVIRRLVDSQARVAVINDRGNPALVNCAERLYDVLAKDHPIVGVYKSGARVRDVVDDLKAAGL
jgi:hypothetical protein